MREGTSCFGQLFCPVGLSIGRYLPLTYNSDKTALQSKFGIYPIVDGVPDIRCPSNQEVQSYDEIVPEWGYANPTENLMQSLISAMEINPSDIEGKRVLLAGFGGGTEFRLLEYLKPAEIYVVEYGMFIRDFAAKYKSTFACRVKFYIGDICNLPFPDNYFNLILCSGVIHQSRTPELAHRSMWRVLEDNGKLIYGHIYQANLHNRRVVADRERFAFHLMEPGKAKRLLKLYSIFYMLLVNTRILGLINRERFRLPILLELNGKRGESFKYYYDTVLDYYLPKYRHAIYTEDILDWFEQCGTKAIKTRKGFIGVKKIVDPTP